MRLTRLVFRRLATAPWRCAPPQSNPLLHPPPPPPAAGEEGQPPLHASHERARRRGRGCRHQGPGRQRRLSAKEHGPPCRRSNRAHAPHAQRMIQDDESEVVWGDPDHRLMTMRHLSDELICPAHTTPPQPLASTRGLGLALPSSPHDAHAHFPLLSCDGGRPSHGRATLLLRGRPEAYDKFR